MRNSCLFIALILFTIACNSRKQKIKPKIGSITESVYASGFIKAENQYNVYSTVNGLLEKLYVQEGDTVKKGDNLFLIENQTSVLNTENAKLALQLSQENLKKNSNLLRELQLNVKLTREKLSIDSSLYYRQKNLWNQNVGAKVDLEQKQLAFEASKTNYNAAVAKYKQAKLQFETEYEQAKNNLKINQEVQSNYKIQSEVDGCVFDILKEQGELITTQSPIAVVGSTDKFLMELLIDEYDITKVHLGQEVLVTMDSYKGKVFRGKITKIYPIMNERSRTFTIEANFVDAPEKLYPNLTVEANILINTKKKTLIIPREYLQDSNYVFVEDEKKVKVKTGLSNYEHVEILEGLDSTQYIYQP